MLNLSQGRAMKRTLPVCDFEPWPTCYLARHKNLPRIRNIHGQFERRNLKSQQNLVIFAALVLGKINVNNVKRRNFLFSSRLQRFFICSVFIRTGAFFIYCLFISHCSFGRVNHSFDAVISKFCN